MDADDIKYEALARLNKTISSVTSDLDLAKRELMSDERSYKIYDEYIALVFFVVRELYLNSNKLARLEQQTKDASEALVDRQLDIIASGTQAGPSFQHSSTHRQGDIVGKRTRGEKESSKHTSKKLKLQSDVDHPDELSFYGIKGANEDQMSRVPAGSGTTTQSPGKKVQTHYPGTRIQKIANFPFRSSSSAALATLQNSFRGLQDKTIMPTNVNVDSGPAETAAAAAASHIVSGALPQRPLVPPQHLLSSTQHLWSSPQQHLPSPPQHHLLSPPQQHLLGPPQQHLMGPPQQHLLSPQQHPLVSRHPPHHLLVPPTKQHLHPGNQLPVVDYSSALLYRQALLQQQQQKQLKKIQADYQESLLTPAMEKQAMDQQRMLNDQRIELELQQALAGQRANVTMEMYKELERKREIEKKQEFDQEQSLLQQKLIENRQLIMNTLEKRRQSEQHDKAMHLIRQNKLMLDEQKLRFMYSQIPTEEEKREEKLKELMESFNNTTMVRLTLDQAIAVMKPMDSYYAKLAQYYDVPDSAFDYDETMSLREKMKLVITYAYEHAKEDNFNITNKDIIPICNYIDIPTFITFQIKRALIGAITKGEQFKEYLRLNNAISGNK